MPILIVSRLAPLLLAGIALASQQGPAPDAWPAWRGSLGTGSAATGSPPIEWAEETDQAAAKNIAWKVPVPGLGISSPIVWRDRIYLTTAIETDQAGTIAEDLPPQSELAVPRPTVIHEFAVVALNRADGSLIWLKKLAEVVPHEGGHKTNSHASASPITDGEHIYASFGSRGLFCLDQTGAIVWSKQLGTMQTRRQYGEGSSPALHGDRLIVNWDHEGDSFLAVFDKRTGDELWRQPRDEVTSWSTPIVVDVDGRPQIIVNATTASRGYDLDSGAVIWSLSGMTVNCIPIPIHADGIAYLMSGYRGQMLQAVRLAGAEGDLQDSRHVLWTHQRSTSYVPSAALYDGRLYFLRGNTAVLSCLDAQTGEVLYEGQRLPGLRSVYASPVCADGRLYFTSRDGVTMVVRHGSTFEQLAVNQLDDEVDASPAIVGDAIYLRGRQHLYCIAERAAAVPTPEICPCIGTLGEAMERTASLSIGDLDGDGDLDIVVANGRHWPGQNRVFVNTGAGVFAAARNLDAELSTTYAAALADLDGDGDLDAVVGNDRRPSYVLFNDGSGHFVRGPQLGKVSSTRSVTLADLDGENGVDVILTNRGETNLICFNDGSGGFGRQGTFGGAFDATITVAAGDLDGDGDLDLAVANRNGQQNHIYRNDGVGGFADAVAYGTGSDQTRGVAIVDIDGDGNLDILNANIGQHNVIYFGDGKGGFARSMQFGGEDYSFALATADLNGDGRLDIAVANVQGPNAIHLQRADGTFETFAFGERNGMTYGLVAADWDGDGRIEIATANSDGNNRLYRFTAR